MTKKCLKNARYQTSFLPFSWHAPPMPWPLPYVNRNLRFRRRLGGSENVCVFFWGGTCRITPVSKWLITMVSKSPNWGYSPSKWPKWLINGVTNQILNGMILQVPSLKLTQKHLTIDFLPKRKLIFQSQHFQEFLLLVSGRVHECFCFLVVF